VNRWDRWTEYSRAPKKPPPEHGIKMKKAGTTWWGQRWIEALQSILRGDAGRLSRGRTYARAGRTHDLVVDGGKVTAKVTGSRPAPYEVTFELRRLEDAVWDAAIAGMAQKAQFSAELLAGRMPEEIDQVFVAAKASLFPLRREDLATDCSCPDTGDPCKHVAATHYVLGEALDRDPFLLFELRGRPKEQVLDALRAARSGASGGAGEAQAPHTAARAVLDVPGVSLGNVTPADYDAPRAALPALGFSFDEPATHGAFLKQLGSPAAWRGESSPAEALAPLVRAAAEKARRLALADAPEPEATDTSGAPSSPSGDDPAPKPRAKKARAKTVKRPKRK
jgi:uncharacterized Zn finger protein